MLRREREEGLGYGSCVETGECTVPVLRSVARAGVGVLLEELFRFSGSDRGRTRRYTFSRPSASGGFSTSPGPTAHRTAAEKRDNRYASGPPRPRRAGVQAAGARCRRA